MAFFSERRILQRKTENVIYHTRILHTFAVKAERPILRIVLSHANSEQNEP